jgi:hypothetical protein
MKILMTGGTGLIGCAVAQALVSRGDEVVVVTRDETSARRCSPEHVVFVTGDCTQPGSWQAEMADADIVINLAGEALASGRWTAKRKREFRRSRIETTRCVVEAMNRTDRRRSLLTASAVGYYGDGGREPLYEEREASGDYLGRLAYEWEYAAFPAGANARVIPLRFGMVLAPEGGALAKMLPPFRLGIGGPLGSGKQYVAWIHLVDVVRAILFIIDHEAIDGPVNITAPDPPQQFEFAKALGAIVGKPAVIPAPALALRIMLGEMSTLALMSSRAVPKVLRAHGFNFSYRDVTEALHDCVPQDVLDPEH